MFPNSPMFKRRPKTELVQRPKTLLLSPAQSLTYPPVQVVEEVASKALEEAEAVVVIAVVEASAALEVAIHPPTELQRRRPQSRSLRPNRLHGTPLQLKPNLPQVHGTLQHPQPPRPHPRKRAMNKAAGAVPSPPLWLQ